MQVPEGVFTTASTSKGSLVIRISTGTRTRRDVRVKIEANEKLCSHKADASAAREYYNEMFKKCKKVGGEKTLSAAFLKKAVSHFSPCKCDSKGIVIYHRSCIPLL